MPTKKIWFVDAQAYLGSVLETDWFIKIFEIGLYRLGTPALFVQIFVAKQCTCANLDVVCPSVYWKPIISLDLDQMQNFEIHNIIVNMYPSLYLCIMQILFYSWYWIAISFSSLETILSLKTNLWIDMIWFYLQSRFHIAFLPAKLTVRLNFF